MRTILALAVVFCSSCIYVKIVKHHPDAGTAAPVASSCSACISDDDCAHGGSCIQIDGDDACVNTCAGDGACSDNESCSAAVSSNGSQVQVCIPKSGSCAVGTGCGACATGQVCDQTSGQCVDAPPADACGTLVAPDAVAQCSSCGSSGDCQANGCFGGWYCDTSNNKCHPAPDDCGGAIEAVPDAGPITGTVTAGGGTVSRVFFAVVGDTRPADINQTASYPSDVIGQIYSDMDALDPKPQFVLTTGDFMFSSKNGSENALQLAKYTTAMATYRGGPVFPTLGNHECTGYTADNCATTTTQNLRAYKAALVDPLGLDLFYAVPFQASDGSWTAKLVVAACNAWDETQKSWLSDQLASPTTYTIVARHEPSTATTAPCVTEMDQLLAGASYDLLLVGHTHTFEHFGKEVVIGNGGAPLTGSAPFGFATVELIPGTGWRVSQIDSSSQAVIRSFVVRPSAP
ncbi:MAG TPA: metallophosphoesterase [Myxococcota bacterium]